MHDLLVFARMSNEAVMNERRFIKAKQEGLNEMLSLNEHKRLVVKRRIRDVLCNILGVFTGAAIIILLSIDWDSLL